MPWSLLLNGLTAVSSAVAFSRSKIVDWRTALPLLVVTTVVAPLGVWILRFVSTCIVWWIYVGVLLFLAYRMAFAPKQDDTNVRYIGMIGSRHKCETILKRLRGDGIREAALARVYAPIGLDLGRPAPEEIAVSILAEVIAVRRGGKAGRRF